MGSCLALREEFREGLSIGPDLWAWAVAERERAALLGELKTADGLRVALARTPLRIRDATLQRPYQRVGIRFLADARTALLADQPGLGKTLQTIGGIIESGVPGPYLVVCPPTAIDSVWRHEIDHWTSGAHLPVPCVGARKEREKTLSNFFQKLPQDISWLLINPEMLRSTKWWVCPTCTAHFKAWDGPKSAVVDCGHNPDRVQIEWERAYHELFSREWGAIVMDESHRVLVRKTGRPTAQRSGAISLKLRPGGLRIALSGTPMRGKPEFLYGTLNWLVPERYTAFGAWSRRYFEIINDGFSDKIGNVIPGRRQELTESLAGLMLRRTKEAVAPDLPPKLRMEVWLTLDGPQERAYREMVAEAPARVKDGVVTANGALAILTRLKQLASSYARWDDDGLAPEIPSNKLDWIMEALDERGILDQPRTRTPEDSKIIIASQYTSMLEAFARAIEERTGIHPLMITGAVTGKLRTRAIEEFQLEDDGARVMLINTTAGGVAITLDRADEMIILDETWVPDDQEQLEDRIHRVSRPRPVTYWYLRTKGTVEETIAAGNLSADAACKALLDGKL